MSFITCHFCSERWWVHSRLVFSLTLITVTRTRRNVSRRHGQREPVILVTHGCSLVANVPSVVVLLSSSGSGDDDDNDDNDEEDNEDNDDNNDNKGGGRRGE